MPFPICTRHALELYRHMRTVIDAVTATNAQKINAASATVNGARADKLKREPGSTVYYVLVGDMIKIGFTTSLEARLPNYPPGTKLLARESGGKPLEQRRHGEFARYRTARNEWYRIEQPLLDHINELRRAHRQAPLTLAELLAQ